MGGMLVGMGVLHFVAPKPFDTIVPTELPGTQRFYTYASGVAEVAAGGLLIAPKTRKIGALAAMALYVGVPLPLRIGAVARLPMQIPMITQALKVYRNS